MAINLYLEDLCVGQTYASPPLSISDEAIKRFASEFDPQPFHLDEQAASATLFQGLAASGWHTAALTMRLLVDSDFKPAGGLIGAGLESLRWPRPVRAGDTLQVITEILAVRPMSSRPTQGIVKVRVTTYRQDQEVVQEYIGNLVVQRRDNMTAM